MRTPQARCDPQGRPARLQTQVSNSPANPLPTAFYSAAARLGHIVSKLLIYRILSTSRGGPSGAEKRFSPAGRGNARSQICVRVVNRRVIEADRFPAATGSVQRTARYAPRAGIEKGATAAE